MERSKEEKELLAKFKEEAARELGITLGKDSKNSARENGAVGGQMVKKMVEFYKNSQK